MTNPEDTVLMPGDTVFVRARLRRGDVSGELLADFNIDECLKVTGLDIAVVESQDIRARERARQGDFEGDVISTLDDRGGRMLWVKITTSGPSFGQFATWKASSCVRAAVPGEDR